MAQQPGHAVGAAAHQVRRHRPEPRPHQRPGGRRHARRGRARRVLREGARSRRRVRQALSAGEAGAERGGDPRGPVDQARGERRDPERARAARHRGDAARQGLHGRQAGHDDARAAGGGAQGAGGDEADLLDPLQRAAREQGDGQGRRAGEGGRDRQGDPDHRARSAPHEPGDAARLVLREGALRRHPLRHRLAPVRPVPVLHRLDEGRDRRRRRSATCTIPQYPGPRGLRRRHAARQRRHRATSAWTGSRRTASTPGATGGSRSSAPTASSRSARTWTSAGREGGNHLFLVDQKETRYVDCSDVALPYGDRAHRRCAESHGDRDAAGARLPGDGAGDHARRRTRRRFPDAVRATCWVLCARCRVPGASCAAVPPR